MKDNLFEINIQSLISFIDIKIDKDSILSIKKGFGKCIAESLFDSINDIKVFIKSGLYKNTKGYVIVRNVKTIVNYNNVVEVLNNIIEEIGTTITDNCKLIGNQYEVFFNSKSYQNDIINIKTFSALLKYFSKVKFHEFKIYTNCGILHTYHNMVDLDCKITSIQYSNNEINVVFKNLNHEQILKIITYHLKYY